MYKVSSSDHKILGLQKLRKSGLCCVRKVARELHIDHEMQVRSMKECSSRKGSWEGTGKKTGPFIGNRRFVFEIRQDR